MRIGGAPLVTQYVNRCLHSVSTLLAQPQPCFAGGALRALQFQSSNFPLGPFRAADAGFPPNPPPSGGPDDDDDDDDRDGRGHFPWEATTIGLIVAGLALLVSSCGGAESEGEAADASGAADDTGGSVDGHGASDASEPADSTSSEDSQIEDPADAPIPTPDQEESADDGTPIGPDVDTIDALDGVPDTNPPPDVVPPDVDAGTPDPDEGPDIPDTDPPPVDAEPDVQPIPDTVDDDADGATDATIDEPDIPVAPDLTEPDVPPAEDLVAADDIAEVMDTAQPDTPATPDIPIIVPDTSDIPDTTGADTADVDIAPPPDAYFTDFICKTLVAYGIDTVSGNPLPKADFLSKLFTKPAPNTQLSVQFDVVDTPANAFVYEVALCYQTKAIAPTTVDPALTDANGKLIAIPHCDSKTWATPLGLPLKPDNVAAIEHQYTAPSPTKYAEWKLLTKLPTTLFGGLLFAQDPVVAAQVVLQPEPGQYCFYGFSSGICDNPPPKCP